MKIQNRVRPLLVMLILLVATVAVAADDQQPIRVVVWDERGRKHPSYENYTGNAIADYLKTRPGLKVKSTGLDEPEQGLSKKVLDDCDVLVWWSHVRNRDISPAVGKEIAGRITSGQLSLVALHSAHWARPFVEAMYERTRIDAMAKLSSAERDKAVIEEVYPPEYRAPKRNAPVTPSIEYDRSEAGRVTVTIRHANCCFPLYRVDAKPGHFTTLLPNHPIARGVPAKFDVPQTEAYDELFHVPAPDAVVFEERWDHGERFRNGMLWKLGKGWVCYFRPGHETYPIYKQPVPLRIVENTIRWCGTKPEASPAAKGR
ncbi:MAG: ThuA domain-containing protein [Candidatus Nealsonbacteria bacterium]|nr:ThuA domain-containing protein [Candidatus Nealsonbacteria bacterium]